MRPTCWVPAEVIRTARQPLKPEVFDVDTSIGELASMIRTLAGSGIELAMRLPAEPLFVLADRSQLDTAIVNMAINARDAMVNKGRLTITARAVDRIPPRQTHAAVAGDFVAIIVTDTGSGISAENIARIFEPFFTAKGVGLGTALGLSQVFGFAKQSGGDLRVETQVGEGSTFSLYLPRAGGADAVEADAIAETPGDGAGICVLVVEDNVGVGDFAATALRERGYDSVLAGNGEQALAELARNRDRFHVVFSDVVMPGMTGVELGNRVRREYPNVAMILVGGFSDILAQPGDHGFELLHKPYSIERLSRVLRKAIAWQAGGRSAELHHQRTEQGHSGASRPPSPPRR